MGTLLTAFDNGYISKFSGKSLDEIACEDIYSNDDDDNDDDVGKERARKKKTGPKPSKLPTVRRLHILHGSPLETQRERSPTRVQLAFVQLYCGQASSCRCTVHADSLASAHFDYTTKPAVIFMIAARRERGYSPVTDAKSPAAQKRTVGGGG
uniref:Uncharacterized protein n=1 Tax=Magallana gigas TaxID=29159 RepID=A0A8W8LTU5_MAGGI